jgi:hypothetical protein
VISFVSEHWGSPIVVVHGTTFQPADLPGFAAIQGDERVGLITYNMQDSACEIVTLDITVEGKGIGTALIEHVKEVARQNGCTRLWLITTNDNLKAVRFYQKRGLELVAVHRGAVAKSRQVKPEIPATGNDGIPIRDEIEMELRLDAISD